MKTKTLATLIGIGSFIVVVLITVIWAINVSNSEITKKSSIRAQQTNCESYFDYTWKVINQDAQVADKYKDAFKEVYTPLIEGRYSDGGGSFMKWIQEHNPNFSPDLYEKVMVAIESCRAGFFVEQQKLIDMDRDYFNWIHTFPNSLIVGNRTPVQIKIIKSLKTDDVYKTGQENDVNVFSK
jgi:hypothetical protein